MRIVNTADMLPLERPCVVCLGYFDGVHLGHQALLSAAREIAKQKGLLFCVHTFDRSPAQALHPETQVPLLTTAEEKQRLLSQAGCDVLAVSTFDEDMRHMPGRKFFEEILLDTLNAEAVVAGEDHRFGYKGDTDASGLQALCEEHGMSLRIIRKVRLPGGELISSSAIRAALAAGDTALAEAMLGRNASQDMILRCGTRQER